MVLLENVYFLIDYNVPLIMPFMQSGSVLNTSCRF